ncbi:MAG: hypothetical protein Q8N23_12610 [Archangium sp.]|nr:hypothetical protein [Archangium sp.]MDP3153512.1 hypothetical protein [Archangium sp.]MDP3574748.1 hypothetical protein [Archangium sp.]
MAINSVTPGSAPVVRSAATDHSAPAASKTPPAATPGYAEGSSYTASSSQAATGQSWGAEESANTSKAVEILGKVSGGDAAKLKGLLSQASMTRDEVVEASNALDKIEGLSPEDRAVVERSLAYGGALANCMAFSKLLMENIMEDLKKTLKL